jgi:hypothetical protein
VGLEVGLILPANGEADSDGPEACGTQPLDLALIDNRQSCFEASETESALPIATSLSIHTVCLYLLFRAVSKSVSEPHSQSLVNPLPFRVQSFTLLAEGL